MACVRSGVLQPALPASLPPVAFPAAGPGDNEVTSFVSRGEGRWPPAPVRIALAGTQEGVQQELGEHCQTASQGEWLGFFGIMGRLV